MKLNRTYMLKKEELTRKCYLIDAQDKILGKVAAKAATLLRGKHKVTYTPHLDCGDTVIIINASKVRVSANKKEDKTYATYSGYPSGLKVLTFNELFKKSPVRIIRLAVDRMIPKGALGEQIRGRLRVYVGEQHQHQAQLPVKIEI